MLPSFATQTVTRQRPARVDDGHGNVVDDWTTPDVLVIDGCSIQPGATAETLINRESVLVTFTVYLPPGSDVQAGDRLLIDGTPQRIVGEPERWQTGILNHVRVTTSRWVG